MDRFVLKAPYPAAGDQPAAIDSLARGVLEGKKNQVLLGVTGSRQDLHHGQRHRTGTEAHAGAGP